MAKKQRKSIVSDSFKNIGDLPTPEKVNEKTKQVLKETEPNKKRRGRPSAIHGKERFTILMMPSKRDIIKIIASLESKQISDLFEQMADNLIKEFIKKYPFLKEKLEDSNRIQKAKKAASEQKKRIKKM